MPIIWWADGPGMPGLRDTAAGGLVDWPWCYGDSAIRARSVGVMVSEEDPLLTATEAAKVVGRYPSTARAVAAARWGKDPRLLRVGGRWAAPLSWWRAALEETPKRAKRGSRQHKTERGEAEDN